MPFVDTENTVVGLAYRRGAVLIERIISLVEQAADQMNWDPTAKEKLQPNRRGGYRCIHFGVTMGQGAKVSPIFRPRMY